MKVVYIEMLELLAAVVDAMEEVKTPVQQSFSASLVDPPTAETVMHVSNESQEHQRPQCNEIGRSARNHEGRQSAKEVVERYQVTQF